MARIVITLSLDDKRDKDVLQWLRALPRGQRSETVRDAIRAHTGSGGVSVGLVYQEVMELKRLLQAGTWAAVPDDGDGRGRRDPLVDEAERKIKSLGL
jgi:hypothetical protein